MHGTQHRSAAALFSWATRSMPSLPAIGSCRGDGATLTLRSARHNASRRALGLRLTPGAVPRRAAILVAQGVAQGPPAGVGQAKPKRDKERCLATSLSSGRRRPTTHRPLRILSSSPVKGWPCGSGASSPVRTGTPGRLVASAPGARRAASPIAMPSCSRRAAAPPPG